MPQGIVLRREVQVCQHLGQKFLLDYYLIGPRFIKILVGVKVSFILFWWLCFLLTRTPHFLSPLFPIPLLEKGDVKSKTEALKKVIIMILNGEKLPGLLMTIIRFVLPLQDHTIKKLLLVFWEIVPKTTPDGRLLQEMILVCDAYRKVNLFFHLRKDPSLTHLSNLYTKNIKLTTHLS